MNSNILPEVYLLKWFIECGVSEIISTVPRSSLNPEIKLELKKEKDLSISKTNKPKNDISNIPNEKEAELLVSKCSSLDELKNALIDFKGCPLSRTATNLVFSDGNPEANLMFLGDMPNEEDDKLGLPFRGEAGALLDKMLSAINQNRENTYLTNLVYWRPPGGRTPTNEEISICLPFVRKHISIVNPKILVLVGSIAAKAILGSDMGITQLRGIWKDLSFDNNSLTIKTISIFHPAFLIRQPSRKKEAWKDLQNIANIFSN